MTWATLLAIAAAMVASLFFAGGATLQELAVGERVGGDPLRQRLRLADLWAVVRAPRWLAGLLLAGIGSLLNATGLVLAPVIVVQPVGTLAVPWSVLLTARVHHRTVPRVKWAAVAATLVGTVGFTVLAAAHASAGTQPVWWRVPVACAVIFLAAEGLGLLGARGRDRWRCFFWASGAAFLYGLESSLIRALSQAVRQTDWMHAPLFWGMVAVLVLGATRAGWMVQQAYASGPAEIVVGSITVTNPVVAVAFGLVVLGEGASITSLTAMMMAVAAVLAISGVAFLSQVGSSARPPDAQADPDPSPPHFGG